jgi:hypothetical protein
MPHDAELIGQTVHEGDFGQHDMVLMERHSAPVAEDGVSEEFDPVKDFDLWRARRVMTMLMSKYPGHFWCVEHDLSQGICKISIPILMGICNWYVINLRTHCDLTIGDVVVAGGEILERYGLQRAGFQIAPFLEARHQHSALVNRRRPVPN